MRQRLRNEWQELLLPAFEKAFGEIAAGERVIHVPKIELHFKVASPEKLTEELPQQIYQQLREHLQSSLCETALPGKASSDHESSAQDRFSTLLQYLRAGSLPWHAMNVDGLNAVIGLKQNASDGVPELLEYFRRNVEAPAFYFRLFQLISDQELTAGLTAAIAERIPHAWRMAAVEIVTALLHSQNVLFKRHTQLQLASAILFHCVTRQDERAPALASVAELLSPDESKSFVQFTSLLSESAAALLQPTVEAGSSGESARRVERISDATTTSVQGSEREPSAANRQLRSEQGESFGSKSSDNEFAWMLSYAGLVLLHPFVARVFESTGIKTAGEAQLDPFKLPRAAALLHFLATGEEEIYEYELGFVKILLGLHPVDSLPVAEGLIQPADKEEVETLLQSVIQHWSALKNTSVPGLRESFLKRGALLRAEEAGWRLQVERKPFDMLLEQIPWTIGVLKLPWMKNPIFTEW